MSNEELEFKVGEDETPATVEMDGDGVQKRIDKLTGRLRETQRREEAAIEYARNLQQRTDELEQRFQRTDADRLIEAKGRIDTQMITLKQIIKKAREEYDIDTETEAQQRLTSMMMDQQRVSDATEYRQQALSRQQQAPQQQAYPPQAQQQQYVAPKAPIDQQAEEWAERNPWFGTNTVMTGAVKGIHLDLIQKEGFDPQSEEYYDEIDRRMRSIFPKELKPTTQQDNRNARPVQTVAPATRSSGVNNSARRTVKLSASQVSMAKRLNVPLEEYAKYVTE